MKKGPRLSSQKNCFSPPSPSNSPATATESFSGHLARDNSSSIQAETLIASMQKKLNPLMSDYIPEGIQFHILKMLPVNSLLRFRCVCKWWKELIDSPLFVQEHIAVQKPRFLVEAFGAPGFVVVDPGDPLRLVEPLRGPIAEVDEQFHVFGTLNGVVCLYDDNGNILLWNPSIRTYSRLRPPGGDNFVWDFGHAHGNSYAFWIDPSNKEFKIIILLFDIAEFEDENVLRDMDGNLYSSTQRDWISVVPPPPPGVVTSKWIPLEQFSAGRAVMIGSVAHWGGSYERGRNEIRVIMSYDFREETFGFVEMPNLKVLASLHPRLCLWHGALSLVYFDESIPHRCEMYSKQEGSWVKLFAVNLFAPIECVFWPLEGMEERGRALVRQRDHESKAKLVLYDTRAGCIDLTRGYWYVDVAYGFVDSLLFPESTS